MMYDYKQRLTIGTLQACLWVSQTTNCVNGNIAIINSCIKLPKVGCIKLKQHRSIPADYKLKSVTVSKNSSQKYFVSVLFEYESQVLPIKPQSFLGLDFSMRELYKDSNGNQPEYPRFYRQMEKKLAREQRKMSRMVRGSNNRAKQRLVIARIHERIASQRKDFLHKLSRLIVQSYDCVCIEDLNMQAMSQGLNFGKSAADNGWGMFTAFLKYKLEEMGKHLVKADKFFASSQICHVCGFKNPETKNLAIREWVCPQCSTCHDRDVNAAVNIKNEGIRLLAV